MAVAEGKLSIDDQILKYFPDDASESSSANLKAIRIRDLLTMNAGHQEELNWRAAEHWARAFLAHPVPHKPGTHFRYNTPATYMLSAIVQKVTGQTVVNYLSPRLFEPLGIRKPVWDSSPQGISIGGYGLYLRTEDIAKFAQLYLQKGMWNGKQLLPADWVQKATSRQVGTGSNPDSDWDQGYGFQFWRCRHGAYRGDPIGHNRGPLVSRDLVQAFVEFIHFSDRFISRPAFLRPDGIRQASRSFASACANSYRSSGDFSRHFTQMSSRSRSTAGHFRWGASSSPSRTSMTVSSAVSPRYEIAAILLSMRNARSESFLAR